MCQSFDWLSAIIMNGHEWPGACREFEYSAGIKPM